MKNANFLTMLTVTCLALTFSCEKDDPVPTLPYEDVFDNWEWYSSKAGLTGIVTYADSVDYDQTLEITSQGEYLWMKDTSVVYDRDFTVEVDTVEGVETFYFLFDDSSEVDQLFEVRNQDTLLLTDQCADCGTHIFLRR